MGFLKEKTMYNNFAHIIENATSQKRLFDSSIESVKDLLDQSVQGSIENPENIHKVEFARTGFRTGWLRGSLSYPWVVVCIIVPAVLDTLI